MRKAIGLMAGPESPPVMCSGALPRLHVETWLESVGQADRSVGSGAICAMGNE